jgi:hypothetical protein
MGPRGTYARLKPLSVFLYQSKDIFALSEAVVMENGVNFAETRFFIAPMPECPDRDLLFEEGSGLGGGGSPGCMSLPFDGRAADPRQFCLPPGICRTRRPRRPGSPDPGDQPLTAEAVEEAPYG